LGGNASRNNRNLSLFEIGRVFEAQGKDRPPLEAEILAGALTGIHGPVLWNGKSQVADLYLGRGILETLVSRVSDLTWTFTRAGHSGCDGLKCEVDGRLIGRVLSVSGALLKRFNLQEPAVYFEVELEPLFSLRRKAVKYQPVSKFPPSDRDLAVVTEDQVSAVEMIQTIRAESDLLEEVALFDVFRGKELGEGKRSTAFSLRFRKAESTLTEKEVDGAVERILTKLKAKYNAVLR
jgi:phenylalanyl-tRNA synthetase beta chain